MSNNKNLKPASKNPVGKPAVSNAQLEKKTQDDKKPEQAAAAPAEKKSTETAIKPQAVPSSTEQLWNQVNDFTSKIAQGGETVAEKQAAKKRLEAEIKAEEAKISDAEDKREALLNKLAGVNAPAKENKDEVPGQQRFMDVSKHQTADEVRKASGR